MFGGERSGLDWGLGGPGAIGGRSVERRRGRDRTDTVGEKIGEEGGDITRVRQGESFKGAVVAKMKAKEFDGDRVVLT